MMEMVRMMMMMTMTMTMTMIKMMTTMTTMTTMMTTMVDRQEELVTVGGDRRADVQYAPMPLEPMYLCRYVV